MTLKTILASISAVLFGGLTAFADSGVPKTYPLKTCVVSGEKLGEHGRPVKVTSEGTDVWLCCKSCVKDFNKEPGKFTGQVKAGTAKS